MAVDLDELLPEVMVVARSIPEPLALRYIREAARDLCRKARNWREWDEFQVTTPDCEGICTVPDASIERIEWAALDGQELKPVAPEWLDSNVRGWAGDTTTAPARYITQLNPNTVTIVPKASGLLKVRLVLIPSRTAVTLPDFILEQYATEIGRGAAGRILIVPDTEYTNPQLGAAQINEFDALLDRLAVKAAKGQQNVPLRTKGSYF